MAPKEQKKAKKTMVGTDKETILRVEPYNLFGKHILRPYVDDGNPVYLPRGVPSEKKFLTVPKVLARANAQHSELCRRPQKGLSMTASCIQELGEFCDANKDDINLAAQSLVDVLGRAENKEFMDARKFPSQQNEMDR